MNLDDLVKKIKLRPGISSLSDDLIKDLIDDTKEVIKEFIHVKSDEDLPSIAITIIKDIVIEKCNRLGTEGLSSQSTNGISENYNNDLSEEVKRKLRRIRKLSYEYCQ